MTAPTRRPNGTMLPGHTANRGGRPANSIASVRERYLPRPDKLMEELVELATNSKSEMVRLAAIREILDRLLGKPPVAIDTTVAKFDLGALYLQALKRANVVIDGDNTINGSNDEPGE
jgi:hypothetical protein